MKTTVQFLGWELVYRGVVDELSFMKAYDVTLHFLMSDGTVRTKTLPVLARSRRFLITSECVIWTEEPQEGCMNDHYLSFQEFLDRVDQNDGESN